MKTFRFRLEPALRLRNAQARIEESKVAAAAAAVARAEAEIRDCDTRLIDEHASTDASALAAWGVWSERTRRHIRDVEVQLRTLRKELDARTADLRAARVRVRIIETLREKALGAWQAEFSKEIDTLASETFLGRYAFRK